MACPPPLSAGAWRPAPAAAARRLHLLPTDRGRTAQVGDGSTVSAGITFISQMYIHIYELSGPTARVASFQLTVGRQSRWGWSGGGASEPNSIPTSSRGLCPTTPPLPPFVPMPPPAPQAVPAPVAAQPRGLRGHHLPGQRGGGEGCVCMCVFRPGTWCMPQAPTTWARRLVCTTSVVYVATTHPDNEVGITS